MSLSLLSPAAVFVGMSFCLAAILAVYFTTVLTGRTEPADDPGQALVDWFVEDEIATIEDGFWGNFHTFEGADLTIEAEPTRRAGDAYVSQMTITRTIPATALGVIEEDRAFARRFDPPPAQPDGLDQAAG